MSPRRRETSQRHLWGDVFNRSHERRLRDLQISSIRDVSETLGETYQRCIWDASMPAGMALSTNTHHVMMKVNLINTLKSSLKPRNLKTKLQLRHIKITFKYFSVSRSIDKLIDTFFYVYFDELILWKKIRFLQKWKYMQMSVSSMVAQK